MNTCTLVCIYTRAHTYTHMHMHYIKPNNQVKYKLLKKEQLKITY